LGLGWLFDPKVDGNVRAKPDSEIIPDFVIHDFLELEKEFGVEY
jgi:hypothetical protein